MDFPCLTSQQQPVLLPRRQRSSVFPEAELIETACRRSLCRPGDCRRDAVNSGDVAGKKSQERHVTELEKHTALDLITKLREGRELRWKRRAGRGSELGC